MIIINNLNNIKPKSLILFVDLVMYEDLDYSINKLRENNKDRIINIYTSKEWSQRFKNDLRVNNIFYYNFRGSISSLFNFRLIINNLKLKYDLILINCDNKFEYLKYFIINLLFLRNKKVIISADQKYYKLTFADYLKILIKFISWIVFIAFELIVCIILMSFLLIINKIKKILL